MLLEVSKPGQPWIERPRWGSNSHTEDFKTLVLLQKAKKIQTPKSVGTVLQPMVVFRNTLFYSVHRQVETGEIVLKFTARKTQRIL